MAFDQATRGRLQKLVNACRGLLSDEFSIQLQQTYGLDPRTGAVTPLSRLGHLDDRQRNTADVLRQTLAHYLGADADDAAHRIAVLDRMLREQAFTVLNRLAALLMIEARGQLIESVSKGYQSQGFQLYSRIAGTALGETGPAYQVYLFSVFDELARELPALFDRYAANAQLFPSETALRAVLAELNHFEVAALWGEDETLGWIYQYFNSKEERKAMRDASQAPRNSRELAVRNQFFTPRYVVEFLVDNTLGRLWFNATSGKSSLAGRCQYLLIKPDEKPEDQPLKLVISVTRDRALLWSITGLEGTLKEPKASFARTGRIGDRCDGGYMCESSACDFAASKCIASKEIDVPVFDYREINKALFEIANRRYIGRNRAAKTYQITLMADGGTPYSTIVSMMGAMRCKMPEVGKNSDGCLLPTDDEALKKNPDPIALKAKLFDTTRAKYDANTMALFPDILFSTGFE